ncbi:hypothetical protein N0M98_30075 [Paenibacillus doosanensis]|uniref:hypothetical protein n=1 Tax=Paenibacillus konkukensis TaxID=2020716 RepID=UPI00201DA734|nr:hypothetical protein [Paenibacillus konkukensis]MCS7464354.1 hypothetical protein [Paenibacillus doosanensis]
MIIAASREKLKINAKCRMLPFLFISLSSSFNRTDIAVRNKWALTPSYSSPPRDMCKIAIKNVGCNTFMAEAGQPSPYGNFTQKLHFQRISDRPLHQSSDFNLFSTAAFSGVSSRLMNNPQLRKCAAHAGLARNLRGAEPGG